MCAVNRKAADFDLFFFLFVFDVLTHDWIIFTQGKTLRGVAFILGHIITVWACRTPQPYIKPVFSFA